jgi:CBS domain-containing protein
MESEIFYIESLETVSGAVKTMIEKGVWSLVVTRSGMPVGVVTERDIIRRCYAKGLSPDATKLDGVMSCPIITIEPDAALGEAMTLMAEKSIRRLYVVDKGKIIGRITQTDAFRKMLSIMAALSAVV